MKAFDHAEIESTFTKGKTSFTRTFAFRLTEDGIEDHECQATDGTHRKTSVRLVEFRPEYRIACPANFDTIAKKIITHFLGNFLVDTCPTIRLVDGYEETNKVLNGVFRQEMWLDHKKGKFQLEGEQFRLEHLSLAAQTHHELHLCANGRSVETFNLADEVPCLRKPLKHANGKTFYYTVCLYGDFLDQSADMLRCHFDIPDEKHVMDGEKVITRQSLMKKVAEKAEEYLQEYLEPLRTDNNERIIKYIQEKEPKYRPLAKHRKTWFDRIPPNLTDDALRAYPKTVRREGDRHILLPRHRKMSQSPTVFG